MSKATLVVGHHEPNHDGLKAAADKLLEAVKGSDAAPKHLVYRPIPGTIPAGQDARLKFGWARHDDGDPHAPIVDDDVAQEVAALASGAINGIGHKDLERTRTGGNPGQAPKYVVALGFRYDAAKHDVIKEAADAFDEANNASASPLNYSVYKTDVEGGRLVLFGADEIDPAVTKKRMSKHHGEERAQELKAKLEDAITDAYAIALELVPELSNV